MKKILLLTITAIMLTSCGGPKLTTRIVRSSLLDYRGYAEQGFLISPYEYTSEYEAIGELEVIVRPAKVKKEYETKLQYSNYTTTYIAQEDITNQELADIAVEEAKKTGADALVNFKILQLPVPNSSEHFFSLTGFCIKRK